MFYKNQFKFNVGAIIGIVNYISGWQMQSIFCSFRSQTANKNKIASKINYINNQRK